jgi:hypothetical protein
MQMASSPISVFITILNYSSLRLFVFNYLGRKNVLPSLSRSNLDIVPGPGLGFEPDFDAVQEAKKYFLDS